MNITKFQDVQIGTVAICFTLAGVLILVIGLVAPEQFVGTLAGGALSLLCGCLMGRIAS